jgi:pantoate kinase
VSKRARAFCPAGISSFFEICDRTSDGKVITDPLQIGARGGGFCPDKGVFTEVTVAEAEKKQIQVFINSEVCPNAQTTKTVVEMLIAKASKAYEVTIKHNVEVPIGAGFGSSAAGALGTCLGLSKALNLNLTYNQLGRIAHIAEVKCRTGLGTVGPLLFGGCGLTLEPGAPGIARLDRVPVSPEHRLVVGTFRSYPTKELLSSPEKREAINKWGQKTLLRILEMPSLQNYMDACKEFALRTGSATSRVQKLMLLSEKAGAIGAAQNMLGEAVHALATVDSVDTVHKAFKKLLPEENILVAKIDFQGARIIG